MSDLVVIVPDWANWLAAVDMGHGIGRRHHMRLAKPPIAPGERVYLVAHSKLRGYAVLTTTSQWTEPPGAGQWVLHHRWFVACTIPEAVADFRGFRVRWWERDDERPFPEWREVARVPQKPRKTRVKKPGGPTGQGGLFG